MLQTTAIITVFLCCLLSLFLFVLQSERKMSNCFLGAFLLLTALDISGWFLSCCIDADSWFESFRRASAFLQMPFFLGFIATSCFIKYKFKPIHLAHLLPFLIAIPFLLTSNLADNPQTSSDSLLMLSMALHLQYYVYITIAIVLLFKFRSIFVQHYSDERSQTFSWLIQLTFISLIAHTLVVLKSVLVYWYTESDLLQHMQLIVSLIALGVTVWIAFKALLQPQLFRGIDKTLKKVSDSWAKSSNRLDGSSEENNKLDQLLKFMESEKPYLEPSLTLQQLASLTNINARELSQLINEQLHLHFFDFINSYRIKIAKEMLLNDTSTTISTILYEVGFNSKSSFNTAFKKHAKVTPREYRKLNAPKIP